MTNKHAETYLASLVTKEIQAIMKLAMMVHICQACGIARCMSFRLASTSSESLSQKTKAKMSLTDSRGWISMEEMSFGSQ